ncbi:hypothetical protein NPIL_604381 [Nephila pilipes]|uniref:Uncharacterized protein n=1 Tax=Nephila pilipes TaxID=299642 RepID=A0A8X6T483_NEPPI|nr:hypothetical protein NPIL_604381 [Nephila pilipes]
MYLGECLCVRFPEKRENSRKECGEIRVREKMQFSVGNMGGYIQCHFSPKRMDRDIWKLNIERMLWVNDRLETERKFCGGCLLHRIQCMKYSSG